MGVVAHFPMPIDYKIVPTTLNVVIAVAPKNAGTFECVVLKRITFNTSAIWTRYRFHKFRLFSLMFLFLPHRHRMWEIRITELICVFPPLLLVIRRDYSIAISSQRHAHVIVAVDGLNYELAEKRLSENSAGRTGANRPAVT